MLARIAHELYWVGRSLSRAEHTARLLDGVFHADLQGRATDAGATTLSWEALLAIMGADREAANGRDDVISLLTLDPGDPASVLFCVAYPVIAGGSIDLGNERGVALFHAMTDRCLAAIRDLNCAELL